MFCSCALLGFMVCFRFRVFDLFKIWLCALFFVHALIYGFVFGFESTFGFVLGFVLWCGFCFWLMLMFFFIAYWL